LQKNTELALYSVLEFAGDPDRHISAAEIADKYGVSPHHLAKVLAQLTRSGIVASVRGAGGGYRFTGNARRLTLLDIIEMFEELAPASAAHHDKPGAATPVEQALGAVLSEIDANAKATFSSITQATMLRLIERQKAGVGRSNPTSSIPSTSRTADRKSP
jgi:Rrf2 family protein